MPGGPTFPVWVNNPYIRQQYYSILSLHPRVEKILIWLFGNPSFPFWLRDEIVKGLDVWQRQSALQVSNSELSIVTIHLSPLLSDVLQSDLKFNTNEGYKKNLGHWLTEQIAALKISSPTFLRTLPNVVCVVDDAETQNYETSHFLLQGERLMLKILQSKILHYLLRVFQVCVGAPKAIFHYLRLLWDGQSTTSAWNQHIKHQQSGVMRLEKIMADDLSKPFVSISVRQIYGSVQFKLKPIIPFGMSSFSIVSSLTFGSSRFGTSQSASFRKKIPLVAPEHIKIIPFSEHSIWLTHLGEHETWVGRGKSGWKFVPKDAWISVDLNERILLGRVVDFGREQYVVPGSLIFEIVDSNQENVGYING
jgi:hypothetical protein